jgi:cardiolipin synthase
MRLVDIATPLLDTLQQIDSASARQMSTVPDSVSKLSSELIRSVQEDSPDLADCLYQSFRQSAARINRTSLAVTGLAWLGGGVPSVQQEMIAIIRSTRRELTLCSYSVTTGAGTLFDEIADVASQGVAVTLIINNLRGQPADIRERICKTAPIAAANMRIFDFTGEEPQSNLHAKVIVADRTTALVGSANLSFHGMVSNHELAVVLRGPIAEEIAIRLDSLRNAADEVDIRSL